MDDGQGPSGDQAASIELESVRRDQPVAFAGRVDRLGFREGLLAAAAALIVLAGAGVVGIAPQAAAPVAAETAGSSATVAPSALAAAPSPTPGPTPAVTPGSRCLAKALGEPPFMTLLAGDHRSIGEQRSLDWGTERPPLDASWRPGAAALARPDEPVILAVGFNACALEWRLSVGAVTLQQQSNPGLDPAYASQGRFQLTLPPTTLRQVTLQLDLRFREGWTSSAWLLFLEPPPVPEALVVAGSAAATALPGCGFTVQLPSGARATDTCSTRQPETLETLHVAPRALVGFRVPHASFDEDQSATLACWLAGATEVGLVVDPACDVEARYDQATDFAFVAPSRAGTWLVEVDGCVRRPTGQACGPWFVVVDTQHPEPTGTGVVD